MSELVKQGINLTEVVEKFGAKGVLLTEEELLKYEEDDQVRVYESEEDAFFQVNDDYASLSAVVSNWLQVETKMLRPYELMKDYALRDQRFAVLEDGRVIFMYE